MPQNTTHKPPTLSVIAATVHTITITPPLDHKTVMEKVHEIEGRLRAKKLKQQRDRRYLRAAGEVGLALAHVALGVVSTNPLKIAAAAASGAQNVYNALKGRSAEDFNNSRILIPQHVDAMGKLCDSSFAPEDKEAIKAIINQNWTDDKKARDLISKLNQNKLTVKDAEDFFKSKPQAFEELQTQIQASIAKLAISDKSKLADISSSMIQDQDRIAVNIKLMIDSFNDRVKATHVKAIAASKARESHKRKAKHEMSI